MNILPLIRAAEALDYAHFVTANPSERDEIESIIANLREILRRKGVSVGSKHTRPLPGSTNTPPGGTAPGSTTKGQ